MEQVVVKSEMQPNEEILLFYVDDNGYSTVDGNIVTATEDMEQVIDDSIQQTVYIEQNPDESDNDDLSEPGPDEQPVEWTTYESQRLLTFYTDNKETFVAGTTKRKFLWSVACKTMLEGKTPYSCEAHLNVLMRQYVEALREERNGKTIDWESWPLNFAHQAFQDDVSIQDDSQQLSTDHHETIVPDVLADQVNITVKKSASRSAGDEKVVNMLTLYLSHKNSLQNVQKDFWQRGLWETIALELGNENDAEYWHKRFLNFKHNYIRLLEKRQVTGPEGITWPYMDLFDQIFANDVEFQRKYKSPNVQILSNQVVEVSPQNIWNSTEVTILAKYYFDCFDEFQDPTIPKRFLWNEVGRLLDKKPELCKGKYESLKNEHFEKHLSDTYVLANRIPVEIIFDNIISRETEIELGKPDPISISDQLVQWKTEELDEMVQMICNRTESFKDRVCYYVCWALVARKLKRTVQSCRNQMDDLITAYRTILAEKKENPDMQIDWRYIELFDRIYDYGMDENLLAGYETLNVREAVAVNSAIPAKVLTKAEKSHKNVESDLGDDELEEKGSVNSRKAFKILEFYQKNKQNFTSNKTKKHSLWAQLAKQINLNATQCAHRFRNLKQVYVRYVQREMDKPDMPIIWPYYQLCKKVFGYRELRKKLKNSKYDSEDNEEWSSADIKKLIAYFAKHFNELSENANDLEIWAELANELGRSANACRSKFLDLRKSYRKLKTMKSRNPAVNVNWKYFDAFDELYHYTSNGTTEGYELMEVDPDLSKGIQEDDDIQCIFVIPEGQDMSDVSNLQNVSQENKIQENGVITDAAKTPIKWAKLTKKRLLILYRDYIRSRENTEISAKDMWKEIAGKLPNKTPLSCRKMFAKLKKDKLSAQNEEEVKKQTPYYALLEEIVALKPRFKKLRSDSEAALKTEKVYKDVPMADETVTKALQLYLQNVEEFVSPRFERKYAWSNLAKAIGEPLNKIFNKINYLKTNPEENAFADVLKQIQLKENAVQINSGNDKSKISDDTEISWTDAETEQLLIWYLANLEKFKNPKFVRKYLWIESANILSKTPLACSKKMSEIRTEYRNMVREKSEELIGWKFYELCQKIYGTGKQKAERGEE